MERKKKTQIKKSITELHTKKQNKTKPTNKTECTKSITKSLVQKKETVCKSCDTQRPDWLITANALSGGAGERAAQRRGGRGGEELEKKALSERVNPECKIHYPKPKEQNPKFYHSVFVCFFVSPFQPWIRLPLGFHPLRLFVRPNVWNN